MSARNDGGPAFPLHSEIRPSLDKEWCGMSLRDYFAAHAPSEAVAAWRFGPTCLQVDTAHDGTKYEYTGPKAYTHEEARYRYADAMLRAREAS